MSMGDSPLEDTESAVLVSVAELQRQLDESLKQLSPATITGGCRFCSLFSKC